MHAEQICDVAQKYRTRIEGLIGERALAGRRTRRRLRKLIAECKKLLKEAEIFAKTGATNPAQRNLVRVQERLQRERVYTLAELESHLAC